MSPRNFLQSTGDESAENFLQSTGDVKPQRCNQCKSREPVPNRRTCAFCLAKAQEVYWNRVKTGICTLCGKQPAEPGHRRCAPCAAHIRRDSMNRYQRTKKKGMCTYCRHHKAMPHRELCFSCFKKDASIRRERTKRQQQQWLNWLIAVYGLVRQWQVLTKEVHSA